MFILFNTALLERARRKSRKHETTSPFGCECGYYKNDFSVRLVPSSSLYSQDIPRRRRLAWRRREGCRTTARTWPLLSTGQTEGLSTDMMWTSFACLALGLSSSCEFFFLRKQIAKLNIKRKLNLYILRRRNFPNLLYFFLITHGLVSTQISPKFQD